MKKYSLSVLLSLLCGLLIVSGIIGIIDPFYHYHKPWFGLEPQLYNQRYQNPGYAAHGNYDSLILGSSMTENFRASEFDEEFECSTIKLSYSDMSMGEFSLTCEKAFETREVKNIFWGLDVWHLTRPYGWNRYNNPTYLYDNKVYNDVEYLLNKSILFDNAYNYVKENLNDNVQDIDEVYMWYKGAIFSKENIMKQVDWNLLECSSDNMQYKEEYLENTKDNLEKNVLPYIEDNPDTTFYIFYPPYSLLQWNKSRYEGELGAYCDVLKYASSQLLEYNNVKLYFFTDVKDVITNLDNYRDINHYSEKINSEMVRWMKDDKYRIDVNNYEQRITDFEKYVKEFDYSIWTTNGNE